VRGNAREGGAEQERKAEQSKKPRTPQPAQGRCGVFFTLRPAARPRGVAEMRVVFAEGTWNAKKKAFKGARIGRPRLLGRPAGARSRALDSKDSGYDVRGGGAEGGRGARGRKPARDGPRSAEPSSPCWAAGRASPLCAGPSAPRRSYQSIRKSSKSAPPAVSSTASKHPFPPDQNEPGSRRWC